MSIIKDAKAKGAYYTPAEVARTLVRWVIRHPHDRLIDPSCGDGEFLSHHQPSTGIESDHKAALVAARRAKGSAVHIGDFFTWAEQTAQRFDCAAGNPPFIRYQSFSGEVRRRAQQVCEQLGVRLSSLASSWAPFLVVSTRLLKEGGRMGFVVPAEIGHAPYAAPVVEFLARSFGRVLIVAIRDTMFQKLAQDTWLLYASDYGEETDRITLAVWDSFKSIARPPVADETVRLDDWRRRSRRLRPFILPGAVRALYDRFTDDHATIQLGEMARVGIGYVTGANDFFHLRPSQAKAAGIPDHCLVPAVRNARMLPSQTVTRATVRDWIARDEACLLLRLSPHEPVPDAVQRYLDSREGQDARQAYKCRNRDPWFVVPDVATPDGFLSYMSGEEPALVANSAACVGTNSLHIVRMKPGHAFSRLQRAWDNPLTRFSVEVEGHPLGGGMLKLEPSEASRILLLNGNLQLDRAEDSLLAEGRSILRRWRHYA